jgi:pimeloyl-ACP methyl ester carboxylesterase
LPAKYVTVQDVAVHYLHTGPTTLPDRPPALDRGRVFVLVHAAGSNAGMWRRQLDALGERHSAVALDFPGHGRSSGVAGRSTIAEYATFLIEFLAAIELGRCILVGRSMGGAIALAVAAGRPDLVEGLVVVCSAARFTLDEAGLATLRDVVRGRLPQQFTAETFSPATGLELMREAWTEQVKTDPRVRYGDLLACQAFDGRELLAAVRAPTLVVAGADDRVTPPGQAAEIAGAIPGARLEVVPQAGHQVPLEQAARFNGLLTAFAESLG